MEKFLEVHKVLSFRIGSCMPIHSLCQVDTLAYNIFNYRRLALSANTRKQRIDTIFWYILSINVDFIMDKENLWIYTAMVFTKKQKQEEIILCAMYCGKKRNFYLIRQKH